MDYLFLLIWTLPVPLVGCTSVRLLSTLLSWNIIKACCTKIHRLSLSAAAPVVWLSDKQTVVYLASLYCGEVTSQHLSPLLLFFMATTFPTPCYLLLPVQLCFSPPPPPFRFADSAHLLHTLCFGQLLFQQQPRIKSWWVLLFWHVWMLSSSWQRSMSADGMGGNEFAWQEGGKVSEWVTWGLSLTKCWGMSVNMQFFFQCLCLHFHRLRHRDPGGGGLWRCLSDTWCEPEKPPQQEVSVFVFALPLLCLWAGLAPGPASVPCGRPRVHRTDSWLRRHLHGNGRCWISQLPVSGIYPQPVGILCSNIGVLWAGKGAVTISAVAFMFSAEPYKNQ